MYSSLLTHFSKSIFIKPKLNLLDWAIKYRYLSRESSANYGRFNPLPYQIEPMLSISNPDVSEVVLMWGAQLGKSEILNCALGYFIHQDPSPIMMMLPTEDMAEDYSKRRLAPMIRDTPEIYDLIHARESNNTITIKNFKGGNLALVGSSSPSKLASKPVRVLLVDECDRCEITKEGHSIDLAQKRTMTFRNRKIIKVSTPTKKDASFIEGAFLKSNQKHYFIPCPKCGEFQTLTFDNVKWARDESGAHLLDKGVFYECIKCSHLMNETEKNTAVTLGKWTAKNPDSKIHGYYLNAIYSPFYSMHEIANSFLESKDDGYKMQVFKNTVLAESYEPPAIRFTQLELYNRREDYTPTTLPDRVIFITAGVDVQGDRLECEIKAWGYGYENWGVEYLILKGATEEPEVWRRLEEILTKRTYYTKEGRTLDISLALIDSGYNTSRVYAFCSRFGRVNPSKGAAEITEKRDVIQHPRKIGANNWLYTIGTFKAKRQIMEMLKAKDFGVNYCHFPYSYNMDYFEQLTAEKLNKVRNKAGYYYYKFELIRERNEALDVFVLNLACAKLLKLDTMKKN